MKIWLLLRIWAVNKPTKSKNVFFQTIVVIMFYRFLMHYEVFSRQENQSIIFCSKLVYRTCLTSCRTNEDLRSYKIRNHPEKPYKNTSVHYSLVPIFFLKMEILSILAKNTENNWLFTVAYYLNVNTRIFFKYFNHYNPWK